MKIDDSSPLNTTIRWQGYRGTDQVTAEAIKGKFASDQPAEYRQVEVESPMQRVSVYRSILGPRSWRCSPFPVLERGWMAIRYPQTGTTERLEIGGKTAGGGPTRPAVNGPVVCILSVGSGRREGRIYRHNTGDSSSQASPCPLSQVLPRPVYIYKKTIGHNRKIASLCVFKPRMRISVFVLTCKKDMPVRVQDGISHSKAGSSQGCVQPEGRNEPTVGPYAVQCQGAVCYTPNSCCSNNNYYTTGKPALTPPASEAGVNAASVATLSTSTAAAVAIGSITVSRPGTQGTVGGQHIPWHVTEWLGCLPSRHIMNPCCTPIGSGMWWNILGTMNSNNSFTWFSTVMGETIYCYPWARNLTARLRPSDL